ncbi:MAG: hypothetical protein K2P63_07190 [Lachnospiraceae bacterium]|nr:hypothetical protein [Lachnospiraceae bacterium]
MEVQETTLLAGSDEIHLSDRNETMQPGTNSLGLIQDIVYMQDTTRLKSVKSYQNITFLKKE